MEVLRLFVFLLPPLELFFGGARRRVKAEKSKNWKWSIEEEEEREYQGALRETSLCSHLLLYQQ